MEIGNKIKNLRSKYNFSQEDLAEKIYVTRQTISNWENSKSFPDLNSLIRMSDIFDITVDELVKGDVEKMKDMIKQEDINKFGKESTIFGLLFILMVVSAPFLLYFLDTTGIVIWAVIAIITFFYGIRVDKLKKTYDISSMKEIDAFLRGEKLDEIERKIEKGKGPYQTIILAALFSTVTLIIFIVIIKLLNFLAI